MAVIIYIDACRHTDMQRVRNMPLTDIHTWGTWYISDLYILVLEHFLQYLIFSLWEHFLWFSSCPVITHLFTPAYLKFAGQYICWYKHPYSAQRWHKFLDHTSYCEWGPTIKMLSVYHRLFFGQLIVPECICSVHASIWPGILACLCFLAFEEQVHFLVKVKSVWSQQKFLFAVPDIYYFINI